MRISGARRATPLGFRTGDGVLSRRKRLMAAARRVAARADRDRRTRFRRTVVRLRAGAGARQRARCGQPHVARFAAAARWCRHRDRGLLAHQCADRCQGRSAVRERGCRSALPAGLRALFKRPDRGDTSARDRNAGLARDARLARGERRLTSALGRLRNTGRTRSARAARARAARRSFRSARRATRRDIVPHLCVGEPTRVWERTRRARGCRGSTGT